MLAVSIVGIAVSASAQLLAVGTKTNADAHRLTTGLHLAVAVREFGYGKTVDELLAYDGKTLSPPIDARGTTVAGLSDWSQVVSVSRVDENNVKFDAGSGSDSRLLRLQVSVSYRGQTVTSEEWLLADTQ